MMDVFKGGNAPVHLVLTAGSYRARISADLQRDRKNTERDNACKRERRKRIKERMQGI